MTAAPEPEVCSSWTRSPLATRRCGSWRASRCRSPRASWSRAATALRLSRADWRYSGPLPSASSRVTIATPRTGTGPGSSSAGQFGGQRSGLADPRRAERDAHRACGAQRCLRGRGQRLLPGRHQDPPQACGQVAAGLRGGQLRGPGGQAGGRLRAGALGERAIQARRLAAGQYLVPGPEPLEGQLTSIIVKQGMHGATSSHARGLAGSHVISPWYGGYERACSSAGSAPAGRSWAGSAVPARSSRRTRMVITVMTRPASAIPDAARNPRVMPTARAWW